MATDRRIISHKLSLLKYARSINNISRACRESRVSRTTYYEYKKRYLMYGIAGLEDRVRSKPKMPNQTKDSIVEKVLSFAKKFPVYGAARIANELGGIVCAATVHHILKKNGLSKKFDRLLAMDDISEDINLSPVFARKLAAAKPKRIQSSHAGELVSFDTFYVCTLKGIGRIYQITAIDTYSSFGFARLYTEKSAASAVDFTSRVISMLAYMQIRVENVLTDNGKEFTSHWGSSRHIFEKYLSSNGIKHRYTKVRCPWTNGFVERFQYTLRDEFYHVNMLRKVYASLDSLQADLDRYLYFYNFQRTHQGYRLKGRKPYQLLYSPVLKPALMP